MDKKEKAPVMATIGAALRLVLLPVALFLGYLGVYGLASHASFMDYFMGTICTVLAIAALVNGIKGIGKMREASASWTRYKLLQSLAEGEELSERLDFFTVLEPDPELQQRLRRWKLDGITARFAVQNDDATGAVRVTFGGEYAGTPEEPVRAWIAQHFDEIETVRSAAVCGGGHDVNDEPRPFHLAVSLQLKGECVHPTRGADPLPPVRLAFGFDGDRVCVVTSTGKAHTCPPGCGIGDAGLPRMLLDDLDPEKHSLCLKCYKDYF